MGDTLDESPPTRSDKPQTLSISSEEAEKKKKKEAAAASVGSTAHPRLHNEPVRERDQSCSNQTTTAPLRRESLNSSEQQHSQPQASSPGGSFHKALGFSSRPGAAATAAGSSSRYSSSVVVGGGIGNLAGTTTRKCVLTLDGYSYVIVASTPENLPSKREEGHACGAGADSSSSGSGIGALTSSAGGAATSSSSSAAASAGGRGSGVATEPNNGEQNSPTSCELGSNIQCTNATINGQVAKHGSLTIVRRSNSRKSFSQIDGQSQSIASPSSSSISFFQAPLSEPLADRLSGRGSNGNAAASASSSSADKNRSVDSAARGGANSVGKMQPSSPNKTNYATDLTQNERYQLARLPSNYRNSVGSEPVGLFNTDQPSDQSLETVSNLSVADAWETETLPPVDTPDALSKAAVRIRSLLRRMDHEVVAYEDMQRNLHYAARVLEAVFIDESRSPTSGKSKLGQIASSSVENEDDAAAKRCNGNCKNLNNNNSNTSCDLHNVATEEQTTSSSDNQTTSIESRTKGVSLAPRTHSGPTGPPERQEVVTKTLQSVQEEQTTSTTTTATTTTTTTTTTITTTVVPKGDGTDGSSGTSGKSETNQAAGQSVSSSSSCSNKATVQRQRRLRTPVWARSMSTNKTYLNNGFIYTSP